LSHSGVLGGLMLCGRRLGQKAWCGRVGTADK
jgi:hypothetical protein